MIGTDDVHDYDSVALNKAGIAAFERFGGSWLIVHCGDIGDQAAPAGALVVAEFDYTVHFAAKVRLHRQIDSGRRWLREPCRASRKRVSLSIPVVLSVPVVVAWYRSYGGQS